MLPSRRFSVPRPAPAQRTGRAPEQDLKCHRGTPEVVTLSRIERSATRFTALLVFLVPLAHSGSLAHPFFLPKEILILVGALVLLGMGVLSYMLEEGAARLSTPALPLALLVFAFGALALIPSVNRGLASPGLASLAAGVTIFWSVTRFVRTTAAAAMLLRAAFGAAALVALGSLVQVFAPGAHLTLGGVSILPPSSAGSTIGDAGLAAQFLLLALPLGVGATALTHGMWRLAPGAGLGLVAAALLYAGKPEAWIVAALSAIMLIAIHALGIARRGGGFGDLIPDLGGNSLRAFLLGGIVVLAVLGVSRLPGVSQSGRPVRPLEGVALLSPTTGDPAIDRAAAVRGTLSLIGRHPLGVGPQSWRHAFLEVAWTGTGESPFTLRHQAQHVGNSFLELTAETGIAGGLVFILLLLVLLLQAGFSGTAGSAPWRIIAYTGFNIIATFCVMSFWGSVLQEPLPALIFWVAAGLTQVAVQQSGGLPDRLGRLRPEERPPLPRIIRRPLAGWVALVTLSVTAVGGGWWLRGRVLASRDTLTAHSALFLGQDQAAILALGRPTVRRSPEPLPHALAGDAYLRMGFGDAALEAFDRALSRSPHYVAGYIGRAAAQQARGRYDLADKDLKKALEIWPDGPDILRAFARLNTRRGRLDTGLDYYAQVSRLEPDNPETYFRVGEILERQGRYDEAIAAFRVCAQKDPRYPSLHLRLGDAYYKKGLYDMALHYHKAAWALDETSVEAILKTANTLHSLGRFCEGLEALKTARDLETVPRGRGIILELIDRVEPGCAKEQAGKP